MHASSARLRHLHSESSSATGLVVKDRKESEAALSRGKCPEELERGELKGISSIVVLPGLAEADEAEAPARGSADREVVGHVLAFQVFVVLARVNDHPRALCSVV